MGSLNDSFVVVVVFLSILVKGKTYKSAINRPIKIQTHHVVRKHTHMLTNDVKLYGRTDSWTNVQMDRQAELSKSDTHECNF